MGRASRRKREGGSESDSPNQPVGKPIDRWLTLVAVAVSIMFGLTDKTPTSIVLWLVVTFLLLIHPAWNCWWIEEKRWRQMSALVAIGAMLMIFGYIQWPVGTRVIDKVSDKVSDLELCSDAKAVAQRIREFHTERRMQDEQYNEGIRKRLLLAKTDEEREALGKERHQFMSRWQDDYNYDYENRFRPKALSLRQQLTDRLPPSSSKDPAGEKLIEDAHFYGIGAVGIEAAADKLEVLARALCPKMFKESDGK